MIEQKNNKSICTNFESCQRSFAVLGTEESCTGDPARAGNEFLFQMQAMMNIEVLNAYEAKKVTACPHCFNTLKNEYPVGGKYEVVHHTEFLKSLLDDGRLTIELTI
jgi:Fe-S oxidoreductase